MIMSYFWCFCTLICAATALFGGKNITQALMEGASNGVQISILIAGPLCLWNGLGALMERLGLVNALATLFRPLLSRLFPSTKTDPTLGGTISANAFAGLAADVNIYFTNYTQAEITAAAGDAWLKNAGEKAQFYFQDTMPTT